VSELKIEISNIHSNLMLNNKTQFSFVFFNKSGQNLSFKFFVNFSFQLSRKKIIVNFSQFHKQKNSTRHNTKILEVNILFLLFIK